MKRSYKLIIIIMTFVLIAGSGIFISKRFNKNKKVINISELSEKFMDNYFEGMSKLNEKDNKENILIVTSLNGLKDTYGATSVVEAPNHQYFLQYADNAQKNNAYNKFKEDDSIESIDENQYIYLEESNYNSWGIEAMGLDGSIEVANPQNLAEVHVAIIDSGCDVDLVSKYYPGKISETYNALTDSTDDMVDTNGHGTHIAGTIAEGTPDNVKIIPIKVSSGSRIAISDIITGINYITYYEKADVMNLSFGSYDYNESLYNTIEAANQKNIISVAAAGNDDRSSLHYPSSFDNTISISSVDSSLVKSSFSNFGKTIDFAAPGTNIKSTLSSSMEIAIENGNTDGEDDFETISGTSMATPHAVNAVAILKGFNKDLTKDNVVSLLKDYAITDLGTVGKDAYYGYGFIRFDRNSFCENISTDDCEEFGVFKTSSKIEATSIEVYQILRTSRNYWTLNNFNETRIRINYSNETTATISIGELQDVVVTGYDPYSSEEQTITVEWQGLTTSFNFTNPANWENGWSYEFVDDNSIRITGFIDFNYGNYFAKKLYIPETIDGYNVVEIGSDSFGNSVFNGATKSEYETITLPSTIREISGNYTFADFTALQEITFLSSSVRITGNYVFYNDTNLFAVYGLIEELGTHTFYLDESLQIVSLSDNITEIPSNTFAGCYSLTDINIPDSLVTIGDSAFYNTILTSVVLPDSVETIGDSAFYQTENHTLQSITLSSDLKSIGTYAFYGTAITEIDLPEGLETIGNRAFGSTEIVDFYLPASVTSVGEKIFLYCGELETIVVDENNTVYDSRNNCNSIIETETNILISGSANSIIPEGVVKIAGGAFYSISISELSIPNTVVELEETALASPTLSKVYVPASVVTIGSNAIKGYTTIWTDTSYYAKEWAVEHSIPYEAINTSIVLPSLDSLEFRAFDKYEADIYVYFDRGVLNGNSYREQKNLLGRRETIDPETVEIIYQDNRDSFRYGDTSFTVTGVTQYGEQIEKTFTVTVLKAIPEYTVPTDLTADLGQTLSEIDLPDGFAWMDEDTVIEQSGEVIYLARFIPTDLENYEIVENIQITVAVSNNKIEIVPVISVSDKTYDGTTNISDELISITSIDSNDYTIVSATSSSADIGEVTATIRLRLTDEKFITHSFDNGLQEKEFNVSMNIVPLAILKPTPVSKTYTYNGSEQTFELTDFDSLKMNITGNIQTNAGDWDVTISLKNNNYIWNDNSSNDIVFRFTINKAEINVTDNTENISVYYDGLPHQLQVSLDGGNYHIKYMNQNEEYVLDECPSYTDVGIYTIKYMVYIDDNYTKYYGEKTLTIVRVVHTVTFYANNGTDDYTTQEIEDSVSTPLNPNTFSREGFTFSGWNTEANGTGSTYTDSQSITITSNVRLYAQWVETFDYIINNYSVDNDNKYICDIVVGTEVGAFTPNIILNYGYGIDVDTIVVNDKNVLYTGGKTRITHGLDLHEEYTNVVVGDVNGNGEIDIIDYVRIMKDIMGTTELSGAYAKAADVNKNSEIDIIDYIRIMKIIMEEE